MNDVFTNAIQDKSPSDAFVFYRPQTKMAKEELFCNKEAWNILSLLLTPKKKETLSMPHVASLCSKWKKLLDKRRSESKKSCGEDTLRDNFGDFIDTLQSCRRQYGVRGMALINEPSSSQAQDGHYLFILERVCPQNLNLSKIFRQWKLSGREQEIAKLLMDDRSNKEIARILGLSINTVKG